MVKTYEPKTGRTNAKHKPQALPVKFRPGFLAGLDNRTDLAKTLRARHQAIIDDIGGVVELSHVKAALVERFVWLEAVLETIEHDLATGAVDKSEALGRWIQAVNSMAGLAKVLGIERKARAMPWLEPTNGHADGAGGTGEK